MKFRIQNNTDSVDIDNKCLGLSAWVPGDPLNLLNTSRGLHIQIRHNRNEETFDAANKLASLISAAPEMLKALKFSLAEWAQYDGANAPEGATEKARIKAIALAKAAIAKAEGI